MEQEPAMTEPQPPPTPTGMSLPARLLNVFAIPGDVFSEVKLSPPAPANWLVPAVLLILVSWLCSWIILSQDSIRYQVSEMTEKSLQKQIEKMKMPADQADKMRTYGAWGMKVSMMVAPVFIAFATPFFWGMVFWLVGAKLMKGSFGFMKAVEVAGLANSIVILEAIVKTLLIVLSGNLFASPSLALLVKDFDPENTTHGFLAAVNVMTVWLLTVRVIGLARLTEVSFARAAGWVFGVWAAYTSLFLGYTLLVKAAFGG
jgi:hypothetical protein